ncbi:Uncharacterised protein [Mycobacteroides abscessus subsp. abscessus]|nr:Uncharacterised protein [Mycobacteroides abscessus subsp. abscessus]
MGDAPFAVTFGVVGFGAVLIELVEQFVGRGPQFLGGLVSRPGHQRLLTLSGGHRIDPARQVRHEIADDFDVFGVDRPRGLSPRRLLPSGRQRLTGQAGAGREVFHVPDPAAGFLAGDVQADPQHVGPVFRADVFRAGLCDQSGQDAVIDRLGRALQTFTPGLQRQQLRDTQPAVIEVRDPGGVSFVRGVRLLDNCRIGESHNRTIVRSTDKKPRHV